MSEEKKGKIWATIIAIGCILVSSWMFYSDYKFEQKASYSLAKVNKLWWECNGCESETYYASYTFETKDGRAVNIRRDSINSRLWDQLGEGEIPALIEYYPEKNPTNYRIVGDNNNFWAWIIMLVGLVSAAYAYFKKAPPKREYVPSFRDEKKSGRKRHVPNT